MVEQEGKVIEALPKEALIGGQSGVHLLVIARDADGNETGRYQDAADLMTQQWAQFAYTQVFGTSGSIITITGATVSVPVWSTLTALTICAGTGTNAAQVSDTKMQTLSGTLAGTCPGTLSAFPPTQSGTSGSFTVTGTITNTSGSSITYSEIGLQMTLGANSYLLTHDVFTGVVVSYTGTLSISYTVTNS